MTARIAALVAEAIAKAEAEASVGVRAHGIMNGETTATVFYAALSLLAARVVAAQDDARLADETTKSTTALWCAMRDEKEKADARAAEAEGRAERAEARLRKSLDEVMYAICENALRGEGESAGAVCKRAIEDAEKEAPRG